jgi:hypothetical protein
MGFYDTIYCDYPLPDADVQKASFQTKDLDQCMHTYKISVSGELFLTERYGEHYDATEPVPVPYNGIITFYGHITHQPHTPPVTVEYSDKDYALVQTIFYEYTATFASGNITRLEREKPWYSWFLESLNGTGSLRLGREYEELERLLVIELQKPDNRRIVISKKTEKEESRISTSHISDIPTEILNTIKKLRYDRILEKHEGPWTWESALKYDNACIVHFKDKNETFVEFTVLMPFPEHHKAQIKMVLCADAEHEEVKTIFFTCPSLAGYDETETNLQWCGFCAVCREVSIPGAGWFENAAPFYVTVLLHETFLIEPEMSDETIFRKVL